MKSTWVTAGRASRVFAAVLGLALAASSSADAQTFTVLYSFAGYPTDGAGPGAGLLMDASGTLYGTTSFGGNVDGAHCGGSGYTGCGTVFELDAKGVEAVLRNFAGPDGATPRSNLVSDAKGDLYGTTRDGGTQGNLGTVFKVSQAGKENVLYRFKREQNGYNPSGLVRDAQGNLYGTNEEGGLTGAGVVFEITPDGKEKILHNLCTGDCLDGASPYPSALIMDAQGNLYGTAAAGGVHGSGTIFKITLPPTD